MLCLDNEILFGVLVVIIIEIFIHKFWQLFQVEIPLMDLLSLLFGFIRVLCEESYKNKTKFN